MEKKAQRLFSSLFAFSSKSVDALFKKARLLGNKDGLKILKSSSMPAESAHGKLLIVIPRKFGKACARNKIRRQIKSIYYEQRLYRNQHNIIILVYRNARRYSFQELLSLLVKTLHTT